MSAYDEAHAHLVGDLRSVADSDWEVVRLDSASDGGGEVAREHPRPWDVPRAVLERWARKDLDRDSDEDEDYYLEEHSVVVLGLTHWDEEIRSLLAERLQDDGDFTQYRTLNAALCLALHEDRRAVPTLLRVLRDGFAASASGVEIGQAALGLALLGEFDWQEDFSAPRGQFFDEPLRLVGLLREARG